MYPSIVTHTQNLCSAFNPLKCTHTVVNAYMEQWAAKSDSVIIRPRLPPKVLNILEKFNGFPIPNSAARALTTLLFKLASVSLILPIPGSYSNTDIC